MIKWFLDLFKKMGLSSSNNYIAPEKNITKVKRRRSASK